MSDDGDPTIPVTSPPTSRPCPICGKPATRDAAPFCSRRCADVDLHRWLGGVYSVPASDLDDDEADDDA